MQTETEAESVVHCFRVSRAVPFFGCGALLGAGVLMLEVAHVTRFNPKLGGNPSFNFRHPAAIGVLAFLLLGSLYLFASSLATVVIDGRGIQYRGLWRRKSISWGRITYVKRLKRATGLIIGSDSDRIVVGWHFVDIDKMAATVENRLRQNEAQ